MGRKQQLAIAVTLAFVVAPGGDTGSATAPEEPVSGDLDESEYGAAFAQQWADLIVEAQAEGELSFVSGPGGENDLAFFEAFGELFGIEIRNLAGATDEVSARVSAERDQGLYDYDIGNLGGSGTTYFLEAGFFTELQPLMIHPDLLELTNFATDYIPFDDVDEKYCANYGIEAEGNIMAFYYNTETVSEEEYDSINSFQDLVDPRWRSRIVIGDILAGDQRTDRNTAWFMLGGEWFDGLFANEPIVTAYQSPRDNADTLIRGDADISLFPPGEEALQEAIEQGLPVAQMDKTMAEGSPRNPIQRVCVMANAAHPAAAQLFLNWVFTMVGGTTYNETTQRTDRLHLRLDVPIGNVDPTIYEAGHNLDIPVTNELAPEFMAANQEADDYLAAKYEELGIVPGS